MQISLSNYTLLSIFYKTTLSYKLTVVECQGLHLDTAEQYLVP